MDQQRILTSRSYADAPIVVSRAATRLMCSGQGARAKLMMNAKQSQQRARELLESAYREEPQLDRDRAINVAAKALANQTAQFSPS